jgi:uncharacterized protein YndB with AHSA1/START domain
VTEDQNRRLELRSFVNAPIDRVFEAWTKPDLIMKWFAPGSILVPRASADPRVGGRYEIEMHGNMDGQVKSRVVSGTYRKVVPNEMLQFTWAWQDSDEPASVVTVQLVERDGGTEVTLTHEQFSTAHARDRHALGWKGCLQNLAARLPTLV